MIVSLTDHDSSPNWNRFWLSHHLLSHFYPMQNQIYNTFWLSHHHNFPTIMIVSILSYLNPIYNTFWLSHHYNCLKSIIVSLFPHQNQIRNTFWLSHHYDCLTHSNYSKLEWVLIGSILWQSHSYPMPNQIYNTFWLSQHCNCPTIQLSHSYLTKTKYVIHSGCHNIIIVSP